MSNDRVVEINTILDEAVRQIALYPDEVQENLSPAIIAERQLDTYARLTAMYPNKLLALYNFPKRLAINAAFPWELLPHNPVGGGRDRTKTAPKVPVITL